MRWPVYILAGGRSARFGSDKARALLDGEPLLARLVKQAEPITARLTVVAQHAGQYDDLVARTIGDAVPGRGPMGGLHTALHDLRADESWLVLLSCDLLRVEGAWVEALWAHRGDARAVAFKPDAYWQPMLALYRRDVAEEVAHRVAGEARSMQGLLRAVGAAAAPLPADWPGRVQANSRDELADFGSTRDTM